MIVSWAVFSMEGRLDDYRCPVHNQTGSIVQYMKDYDASFRILEEPLMITGIGVAFAKEDDRGICEQMGQTQEEMRLDGTSLKIIEKYLDDPQKYLEVEKNGSSCSAV